MIKKTYVTHFQKDHGPGKLAFVLKKGLQQLGVELVSFNDAEHISCLQWIDDKLTVEGFAGKKALLGPNIWESPAERPHVVNRFSDFVVPSSWVRDKHLDEVDLPPEKNIHIWSGGIETDMWKPTPVDPDIDCFIYWKNRDDDELAQVVTTLQQLGLKAALVKYGSYREEQLFEICIRSKFCILLTNTESQGYAYMQILSTGTPCFTINQSMWVSRDGTETRPASSVPYFDDRCGVISDLIDGSKLSNFIDNLSNYNPRDYILQYHTVEKSTMRYLELLENAGS